MFPKNEVQLSSLNAFLSDRRFDVFICSASYEERCKSIPLAVSGNSNVGKRLVCFNQTSSATVAANAQDLLDILGETAERVPLDKTNPLVTADSIQRVLSRAGGDDDNLSYLIDITTFTHEALLILLLLIKSRAKHSTVVLAYAPAAEYSVGLPSAQKWLSKGIVDIRTVLGYPGNVRPSRKSHLMILVGFEADRAERLIDEYQPHVISLGFGQHGTATAIQHEEVNRLALQRIATKVSNYCEFEFSCVDVSEAEIAVSRQALLFPDCNVVVAPMNTKLSTAGVAWSTFRNPDIQLCYASATLYNIDGYSKPGKTCILSELPPEYWRSPPGK